MDYETFRGNLDTLILSALKDKSVKAYDLLRLLPLPFRVSLSPGSLYSRLTSLEADKLIERVEASESASRRSYALTDKGRRVLVGRLVSVKELANHLKKEVVR